MYLAIAATGIITYVTLRLAEPIQRRLGKTGIHILGRVLGLVLAGIAVQFVLNGLTAAGLIAKPKAVGWVERRFAASPPWARTVGLRRGLAGAHPTDVASPSTPCHSVSVACSPTEIPSWSLPNAANLRLASPLEVSARPGRVHRPLPARSRAAGSWKCRRSTSNSSAC